MAEQTDHMALFNMLFNGEHQQGKKAMDLYHSTENDKNPGWKNDKTKSKAIEELKVIDINLYNNVKAITNDSLVVRPNTFTQVEVKIPATAAAVHDMVKQIEHGPEDTRETASKQGKLMDWFGKHFFHAYMVLLD